MHLPSEHVYTPEACGCGYTFRSLPETLVTPTSVHSPRVVVVDCTTRRWTVGNVSREGEGGGEADARGYCQCGSLQAQEVPARVSQVVSREQDG